MALGELISGGAPITVMSKFLLSALMAVNRQKGDRKRPVPNMLLHIGLLRQLQGVIYIESQVTYRALQLGMPQK